MRLIQTLYFSIKSFSLVSVLSSLKVKNVKMLCDHIKNTDSSAVSGVK